jgi:hypothetical protein
MPSSAAASLQHEPVNTTSENIVSHAHFQDKAVLVKSE